METFTTYLDQDTSRVLALIRRTLQHVQQEEDQTDDIYQSLRSSLDEIRLLVQGMCKHRDETKLTALQMAASTGGSSSNAQSQPERQYVSPSECHCPGESFHIDLRSDTSTSASELEEEDHEEAEAYVPAPLVSGLRPAKKLTNAFAKWSLAGTSRRSKLSSLSSASNSLSRASSAGAEEVSFIDTSTVPTSRQPSRRSEYSHASSSPSRAPSRPALTPSSVSHGILPPILPPRNPRRSITMSSMEESVYRADALLPSLRPPSSEIPAFSTSPARPFDVDSITGSVHSRTSHRSPVSAGSSSPLPLFAISPPDKIIIDSADMPTDWNQRSPEPSSYRGVRLSQTHLVSSSSSSSSSKSDKGQGHASTVFFVDISPASYILVSKHGDKTIKVHGLPQCNLQTSLKVNFYVQMQDRSRDFFVTSHAILSETRSLLAAATRFGDTLEIWNWALKKRLQTIDAVYRWAVARSDIYATPFRPLACYREVEDAIYLYPVTDTHDQAHPNGPSKAKPFGNPTILSLHAAGLPCVPKLPELAYSSTAPLLVAAAGPRAPRPGHSPPEHAAMLIAWDLSSSYLSTTATQRPSYFCMPTQHKGLETALPCGLAVHGDWTVSIWIPHNVRVIGSSGVWQVEPVKVPSRFVLVWNMAEDTTSVFSIPNENTVACISPDCRYVAYRQGLGKGGRDGRDGRPSLVILDALDGGRELGRTPASLNQRHAIADDGSIDPSRVSSLCFSSDGGLLIVGNRDGSMEVYKVDACRG